MDLAARALWHFRSKINPIPQRIVHGTTIEILWTVFPSVILMFIAIPSFALLYSMDDVVVDPAITIKAIGHQWYWTYEYIIPEDDLESGKLRLLEVDNRVVVAAKTHLHEKGFNYYGQCSEICGTNHAFMPIVIEAVSTKD
ncbi:hypothetical protein AAZX31_15G138400 [Glycine max]